MPNNFDKLFNQAQGNELINALKGIKSSLDVNYPLETVNVTLSNNAQNITPSENYYGLGQVNVPGMNLSDMTILVNGNYDPVTSGLDGYGKLNVNVPTWGQADEGKVVSNNALVPQTNREVNANGTYDTTLNNSVLVNVPNTYGSEDEGKVVMNNALVPQTNRSITENGTYDTTTNDEVVVNVEGSGSGVILSGTETPSNAIGEDENLYVKYSVKTVPQYDYSIAIDNIYRKVNGAWVDYTEPAPPTKGVHIWTKSTGGYDAAMYVQNGYWDADNDQFVATGEIDSVIYTSVRSSTYDCNGIATLGYPGGWYVRATTNVTDGTNQYSSGDVVKNWQYNESVDFYVWRDV